MILSQSKARWVAFAGFSLLALMFGNVMARAANRAERPNLVFFITDDMQRYMFNCLPEGRGQNLSPNLDRLAAEGTLMTQQYVSAPVCTPSRFTCMTGKYASRTNSPGFQRATANEGQSVVGWNTKVVPGDPTIASRLQAAGYRTGFVGKNHTIEAPGRTSVGYHEDPTDPAVKARLVANQKREQEAMHACGFDFAGSLYYNNPDGNGPKALACHNLDWIAQAGLEFIDRYHDQPFFLYFASTVPHGPGEADRSWNADRRITAEGFLDEPLQVLPPAESIPRRLRAAGLEVNNTLANVLWLDDALGAVLGKLEEYGLQENTIVVFFNDHGQGAKGTLYQGGINDPSILWRDGGFPAGERCDTPVSNVDFVPTILDLCGVPVAKDQFDGRSFRSALFGSNEPVHESLFFEMGYSRAVLKGKYKYLALRYPEKAVQMTAEQRRETLEKFNAKQRDHDKRIITTDPSAPFSHISLIPGGGGAEAASTGKYPGYYDPDQLYDIERDPREQNNLADDPEYAEVLEAMKDELRKYLNDLPGGFAELKP